MPSPFRTAVCLECNAVWQTRSGAARTCSPKCRAQVRDREHGKRKGRPLRDYDPALVERVRQLYESGMTREEVQAAIGPGVKVENIMKRHGIKTRPAIKRSQSGSANASWRGDDASYTALHLRVQVARGRPQFCVRCQTTAPGRYEWANLTGNYLDIDDYERMCVWCHRRYDSERRKQSGKRTSPNRG